MAEFEDQVQPVALQNCQIKKSRRSDVLEVVLKPPKKIVIKDIAKGATNPTILLSELNNWKPFDWVSINDKVVKLITVSGGLPSKMSF